MRAYLLILGCGVWDSITIPRLGQHRGRIVIVPVETRSWKDRRIENALCIAWLLAKVDFSVGVAVALIICR